MKDNKELIIEIPKGHEIDQEKSTFEKIIFKETKKVVTYADVAEKLFKDKNIWCLDSRGNPIETGSDSLSWGDSDNSTTKEQIESIMALNKLCNVAKYLNEDMCSEHREKIFYIVYNKTLLNLQIENHSNWLSSSVYFRSKELAQQAIEILGEEEIKKALTLNH